MVAAVALGRRRRAPRRLAACFWMTKERAFDFHVFLVSGGSAVTESAARRQLSGQPPSPNRAVGPQCIRRLWPSPELRAPGREMKLRSLPVLVDRRVCFF